MTKQTFKDKPPCLTLVRHGFSEEDVWRKVLGGAERLHVLSMQGGFLDAPQRIPAGSMTAGGCFGPAVTTAER